METAAIIAILELILKLAPFVPVVAADIVALGNLLFHAQAGNELPVDLVARAQSIKARLDAVAEANGL